MKIKFFILSICSLFLLVSCSDDDDTTIEDLSGTYVGTKIELSNCNDPEENLNYSGNSAEGICFEEDGVQGCIKIELTFNDGSYTANYSIDIAGTTISSTTSGTYDPAQGAEEICIDGDCGDIQITNSGNRIIFSGVDTETGCNLRFELEKN